MIYLEKATNAMPFLLELWGEHLTPPPSKINSTSISVPSSLKEMKCFKCHTQCVHITYGYTVLTFQDSRAERQWSAE